MTNPAGTCSAERPVVAAIVLAAGLSRRMGASKMCLPWGDTTVIGQVVRNLAQAGIDEILVVTGGARAEVEAALRGSPARAVFNPRFAEDHMLLSLQAGLSQLPDAVQAALVALGDQPRVPASVVQAILRAYQERQATLVVPSYRMQRGHPWLVARSLWSEIIALQPPSTLRDVLNAHAADILYLAVEDDAVIQDLDTPEDYARQRPRRGPRAA